MRVTRRGVGSDAAGHEQGERRRRRSIGTLDKCKCAWGGCLGPVQAQMKKGKIFARVVFDAKY